MGTIPYFNKEGKRLRGATTHIGQNIGWGKDGLIYWGWSVGYNDKMTLDEARNQATVPGTIVHLLIETDLTGKIPEFPEHTEEDMKKAETAFLMYLEWKDQFEIKPIAVEPHLISEKYQFGLTPDLIAETKNGLALVDWKSGRIYANTLIQIASYKLGWEENNPDKLLDGGFHILRIAKNEENPHFHHSYWASLPDEAWLALKCALSLTEYEKVLKKLL